MVLLFWVFVASRTLAALDPETKKPYRIQVVLRVAPNRVFTPLFHDQLQREVGNRLRLAFGALAKIEVAREHPLFSAIDTKGLDHAVETWDAVSGRATHFVLVDYVAGTYQIRTRSYDGMTGLPGPATLPLRSPDRTGVAGAIAQRIESSFSPVGTVTEVDKMVTLKLKGADLGVPLDRWVKPGHVFAVSRITQANGKQRATRVDWALLEVRSVADAGVLHCKYWQRYQEDALTETAGTLGYRALLLPTSPGRVKVQLLDETTLQPLDGVRLRVRIPGGGKPVELLTNRDGLAITREHFPHFALVRVLSGDAVRAQFPVERIAGRTVVARVKLKEDRESLAALEVRHSAWLRRAYENVRISFERTAELSALLNQSLQAALDAAKKRLPLLEEEITYLTREADQLTRHFRDKKRTLDLREGEQQIAELRAQAKALGEFIGRVDLALKDAGPEKSVGLVQLSERARLLQAEADFAGAIRVFEQLRQIRPEQKEIQDRLDRLKKAWQTHGKEHEAARQFFYDVWPSLDVPGLRAKLEDARKHLATCKAAGDRLTPIKLLGVNARHTVNLKKQLDQLKRTDNEDNRNKAKAILQISAGLLRLHQDAAAWIGATKK
ncbi:MAG: hypothetical protein HYX68_18560 [Planctomycetes bacterium]|nr:hypothetical protein [Planctomycetota bacterium]